MSQTELMLIDVSYIGHSTYHANGPETAPEHVAKQIVVRVQQLAANHPHAAVCCDSPRSFRRELDPAYKAQRDTTDRAAVYHQIDLACAQLKADGFPVWSADGFEADDIIATATAKALAIEGARVLIASSDKDLLQLVSDRVTVQGLRDEKGMLTTNGTQMTPATVLEKLKIRPEQVRDYLALVGDNSDNIEGANGIGKVKAVALLSEHGTLDALYAALANGQPKGITPTMRTALMEFRDRLRGPDGAAGSAGPDVNIRDGWQRVGLEHVRKLLTLRTDAPIPFEEIAAERIPKPMGDMPEQADERWTRSGRNQGAPPEPRELTEAQAVDAATAAAQKAAERIKQTETTQSLTVAPSIPLPVRREQPPPLDATIVQSVLLQGDLSRLNPSQRIAYYNRVCESLGLNPMTQPFAYLRLNGKEVLYAKKDAAEQLRFIHGISIDPRGFTREVIEGVYVVTAPASMPNGRTDVSTGAVAIDGLKGEARSNAMMKAETKAKRRVTLSICGLGMLDETEVETVEAQ